MMLDDACLDEQVNIGNDLWGLLKLNPVSQRRYLNFMTEFNPVIKFYYPCYDRVRRPAGSRHPVVVPTAVYPGYVFVRLDCDLRVILDGPVRVYFVRFGGNGRGKQGRIGTIREEVINRLQMMERSGQLVREEVKENPFMAGRGVRVHTPVADINGVIVMCTQSSRRAIVDTVLGRWDVPIHQVICL
jgi:hypothetical protein